MVTTLIPRHPNPLTQPEQGRSDCEQILLQGISWETFELLIRELESQPSKRLTYNHGSLEIWMTRTSLSIPRLPIYAH